MLMVLGATLSQDYSTFTTFRSLQGFFGTVPQVIGLPIIHDLYKPDGMSPQMLGLYPAITWADHGHGNRMATYD